MNKKVNKKGFTIMEMLIVVAIIAVLVAIAIPTFNGALTKAKEATDVANIRAGYAELQVALLTDNVDIPDAANDATNKNGFLDLYVKSGLNYKDKFGYSVTNDVATITYDADKLDDGKDYTWTVESPTIN